MTACQRMRQLSDVLRGLSLPIVAHFSGQNSINFSLKMPETATTCNLHTNFLSALLSPRAG